jgi:hypothetical protein
MAFAVIMPATKELRRWPAVAAVALLAALWCLPKRDPLQRLPTARWQGPEHAKAWIRAANGPVLLRGAPGGMGREDFMEEGDALTLQLPFVVQG